MVNPYLLEKMRLETVCANECPQKDKPNYDIKNCNCYKKEIIEHYTNLAQQIENCITFLDEGDFEREPTSELERKLKEAWFAKAVNGVVENTEEIISYKEVKNQMSDEERVYNC